jgi:hypothetical protein
LLADRFLAIYTPTSLSIDGLAPPITAATTITSVDNAGETVAVAVAAGAGVVAGGGLAAWLFKPMPGAPRSDTLIGSVVDILNNHNKRDLAK